MTSAQPPAEPGFDRLAKTYTDHAAVPAEAGARLLERLDGLRFAPARILELGCADGRHCLALHQRYPAARIIGLDSSAGMLCRARRRRGIWKRRFELLRGDFHALPLAGEQFDLVFANLSLSWARDALESLKAARRVLRPGGLFLGSVYGPDTLAELGDEFRLSAAFRPDVQALGSLLVRAGFLEPVLDTDWITTTHSSLETLLAEARGMGVVNHEATSAGRPEGSPLTRATWEIVGASAWAPEPGQPSRSGTGEEVSIPIDRIGRRRRS